MFTDIINSPMRNGTFPEELKLAEVTPSFKKTYLFDKKAPKDQLVYCHMFQKSMGE